jgi:hypothetical protein
MRNGTTGPNCLSTDRKTVATTPAALAQKAVRNGKYGRVVSGDVSHAKLLQEQDDRPLATAAPNRTRSRFHRRRCDAIDGISLIVGWRSMCWSRAPSTVSGHGSDQRTPQSRLPVDAFSPSTPFRPFALDNGGLL